MMTALLMAVAVHGVVTVQNGLPLPGVTITATQNGAVYTVVTNEKGEFAFSELAPDRPYRLRATADLFHPVNVKRRPSAEPVRLVMESTVTCIIYAPVLEIPPLSGVSLRHGELSKLPF